MPLLSVYQFVLMLYFHKCRFAIQPNHPMGPGCSSICLPARLTAGPGAQCLGEEQELSDEQQREGDSSTIAQKAGSALVRTGGLSQLIKERYNRKQMFCFNFYWKREAFVHSLKETHILECVS